MGQVTNDLHTAIPVLGSATYCDRSSYYVRWMQHLSSNFYTLFRIPHDASPNDIKTAYHRTLLRLHPDKQPQVAHHHHDAHVIAANASANETTESPPASVDVASLKEAYRTLSDVGLRAAYDGSLRRGESTPSYGPRPAQVISLEEFTMITETRAAEAGSRVSMNTDADAVQEWWHRCRCGGAYRVTLDDLENGTHLVGCEGCSEVILVGYEEAPATDDEGD